jgi:hypothetical protein
LRRKVPRQVGRALQLFLGGRPVGDEQLAAIDLLQQRVQRDVQRVADEVVDVFRIQIGLPVVPRKQRFDQSVEHGLERVARGCAPDRPVVPDVVRDIA